MGKTRRNLGYSYFRKPKGAKQAQVNDARAVPPDAWNDGSYAAAGEFYPPLKRYLKAQVGKTWNETQTHILNKWGARAVLEAKRLLSRGPWKNWPYIDHNGVIRTEKD